MTHHSITLLGLGAENPRDFLASLGLLRLVDQVWPDSKAQLSWAKGTGIPTLHTHDELPSDWPLKSWSYLCDWKESSSNPFTPVPVESISSADFRSRLCQRLTDGNSLAVLLASALASQLDHEKSGRRSDFLIESGQRRVLKGIDDLLAQPVLGQRLEGELRGSEKPVKVSNTSRWNPSEFRSAAYTTTDPAKTDFFDYPCLNVLAFVGLTFYPAVDTLGGRKTPGFRRFNRAQEFSWPVWTEPLLLSSISSLLHHPAVHEDPPNSRTLHFMGVHSVWRSRKFGDANNKYFGTATPAF